MNEAARARQLHAAGQMQEAASLYRVALEGSPDDVRLRRDFAALLMQARREAEAIELLDDPVLGEEADLDTLLILALCLRATRQFDRACVIAQEVVNAFPQIAMGWLLLGSAHVSLGKGRQAEHALRRCLALDASLPEAWHYLGECLQAQARWYEAISAFEVSARHQPGEVFNIALCQERAGLLELAEANYRKATQLMPGRADVLARLAQVQALRCRSGDEAETSRALAQALSSDMADDDAPEPFVLAFLDLDESLKARALQRHCDRLLPTANATSHSPDRAARGRRIRIGYLSADFGAHAVGELVRGHLSAHDHTHFQVHAYSLGPPGDAATEEIRSGSDGFLDCEGMGDSELETAIRSDGIDVLIDLGGFTHGARPGVLARRPASLQLGWLGFIHGHQAPWLDGLLMDAHVAPRGHPWPYRDRIVHLPGTMFPGSPTARGQRDRDRFGLPEDAFVLASFNSPYKLTPALLHAWARIMRLAPAAHLMAYIPEAAREGFFQQWSASGGPVDRLHVVGAVSLAEQASRAASCDLFLDAFRYQAGATAMNAIGNGLPVLSLGSGQTPLSRLSVSLNRYLGMDELVCRDIDEYASSAATLANDRAKSNDLRARLESRVLSRGLFDPRRAARSLEQAIRDLMRDGEGPRARH